MTSSAALRMILEQYRFTSDIDMSVRSSMMKARKRILFGILKKSGRYSILIMMSLHLVYFLKKLGIHISVAKGIVVIIAATVGTVIATVAVAGILYINRMDESGKIGPVETDIPVKESRIVTKSKIKQEQKAVGPLLYQLQIAALKCSDEEKKIAVIFETAMRDKIIKINGKAGAVLLEDSKDYIAPNILAGSIFRSGKEITISVRLVDSETSKVKLMITEKIRSEEDLPSAVDKIAESISHEM